MRVILLAGALTLGLVITDPAICAQNSISSPDGSQSVPGETEDPANPNPMPDPSDPLPPIAEPLPPEMQIPEPPVIIDNTKPIGPPATAPSAGADVAVSGATSVDKLMPQPAIKTYPPCTRKLQDNCRNPGEGPRQSRK